MKVKKYLGIVMWILCIIFVAKYVSVETVAYGAEIEWEYRTLLDGTLEITGYAYSTYDLIIPSEISGKKVTSIGEEAFRASTLRTINIPEGITNIGNRAFAYCDYLQEITIPESVIAIGDNAFEECSRLRSVVLLYGVETIGDYAFYCCQNLSEIIFPDSVYSIGESALDNCTTLRSVKLPNQIRRIPGSMFAGCVSLKEVKIPESVETIEWNAFYGCSYLEEIQLPDSIRNIYHAAFKGCSSLKVVNIPKGMMIISKEVFSGCRSLDNLIIHDGITDIEEMAFYNCSSLESVVFPENLIYIGEEAFCGCELKSAIFMNPNILFPWEGYVFTYDFENGIKPDLVFYSSNGDSAHKYALSWKYTWRDKDNPTITEDIIELDTTYFTYNGVEQKPSVSVVYADKTLVLGTDYTVSYRNNINAGKGEVIVTGIGNCSGTATKTFTIEPIEITSATLSNTVYSYTGTELKPEVIVKYGEKTLVSGTDYLITYRDNLNVGTATATVTGIGNYTGTIKNTFEITVQVITDAVLETDSFVYDGTWKKPEVSVKNNGTLLKENSDYYCSYSNNQNVGEGTVTIFGKGNFTGTIQKSFVITPAPLPEVLLNDRIFVYNGKEQLALVYVIDGDKYLDETNYSVEISDNINAGVATVTVTGIGNYTGTVTMNYIINPASITSVIIDDDIFTYDGTEKEPEVFAMSGMSTLSEGLDYTLEYSNNMNAGIATATVKGIGNYTGTMSRTFKIQPKKITSVDMKNTTYTYNGFAKKPIVTVKAGEETLKKDVNYTLTYSNNINPGIATVTVSGKGNYTGVLNKTFVINLPKVSNFKQTTTYSTSKISMSWSKVTGATGYAVYRANSKNGSYKYLKSVTTNSCSHAGLKAGTKYYYKVRAYKTINGKKVYGEYSDVKSMLTKPAAPANFTVVLKSRTAKISWSKSVAAQGYEIYVSNSRYGTYTTLKIVGTMTTTYSKSGLVKGKKYYFKMRAYTKNASGVKVYSGYSKVKAVNI